MRKYKIITGVLAIVQIVLVALVLLAFQVQDTTLAKGEVDDFNTGWELVREDGSTESISSLPYNTTSAAGEVVHLRKQIPQNYYGKTLFFLSADKEIIVRMDGRTIYSFGENDTRVFGHTPGSIMNFVDLPRWTGTGWLDIEMVSAYDDYATYLTNMRIADGAVAIIHVLRENMLNIICSIILIFLSIFIFALSILQKLSGRPQNGMGYLAIVMLWAAAYYGIETKILHIIYGNQTLYSILIFMFLMYFPIFFCWYYIYSFKEDSRILRILMMVSFCNVIVQITLQVLNIVDFIQMAFVSHILMFLTIIICLIKLIRIAWKDRAGNMWLQVAALAFVFCGSVVDIIRSYVIRVGDLGKYSRYGFALYGIIMAVVHVQRIVNDSVAQEIENKEYLEQEVDRKTKALQHSREKTKNLLMQTIMALSRTVDAKDRYTNGHSRRVAEYARQLAVRMGKTEEEQEQIYYAGLLHDVGKIRIPDDIINKPGKLTDEEFNYIKLHPVTGYNILKRISGNPILATGAKYHHERYDGKGYPNGLKGSNIPEVARIIGVADAYDAMASNRSYRDALPQEIVRSEIVKGRGTQFDPEIADLMLQMIDDDPEYKMCQTDSLHKNVLVVDDEWIYIRMIENIMKDEPMYTIFSARNGKDALDMLEHNRIDSVILDVMMPDMDGFEVLEKIRERSEVPVAFLSGDKTIDTMSRAEKLGVDEYITKPFLPLELKEILHSLTNEA